MKNYLQFNREKWQSFSATESVKITKEELAKIKSLGDIINLTDVQEVYSSLIKYLYLVYQGKRSLQQKQSEFLQQKVASAPFIIGISGSVAVGKSTTARLLQLLLSRTYPDLKVHLMTTDGFIYSNQELERRNLTDRKGFPESYNMKLLTDFLQDVLSGKKDIVYPLYSQELSDIVPGEYGHVCEPDILIIEGINTLQLPTNGQIVTSDFFDFSIYIDAPEDLIEKWFMQRFVRVMELNKNNPHNFYYEMANGPRDEALKFAEETWQMVNLVNLREYIAPTKQRANLILHKTAGHVIDQIYLKQI
ncbi:MULTISPECIES: type I pantothenate kinase [Lactobacillus]|uniref:Pantothenate kinase n=1 Tax=Lactobacillus kullabergensis TaxID=1218493 RepID=A0A0F4LNB5_9LACO|nr:MULTISPECIES: type I pantothenate kinase [Lactobacillus]KJY59066.1 Pantothenate kinase [Lactobacillus kullabergensis]MBC6370645.1 type I pantothenate kinase [Lactobacillus kullabergensis]RMC56839.1 type I pantothenate kinase [Lactobacillus sp. ESL0261]